MRRPLLIAVLAALCASDAGAVVRFDSPSLMQHAVATYANNEPQNFSLADVDGDGFVDALFSATFNNLVVSRGVGDGTFRAPVPYSAPDDMRYGVVADFDGDEALDVGYANWTSCGVMFGDGTGTQWTPVIIASGAGAATAAGDFDGDGRSDLVAIIPIGDSGRVQCYLSRPGRTFQAVIQGFPEIHQTFLNAMSGDLDGDGHTDLVVGVRGAGRVLVLLGRGDGGFDLRSIPADNLNVQDLDLADATGDGVLDLVIAAYSRVEFLRGIGDGTFTSSAIVSSLSSHRTCKFADVTEDGILDIVFTRVQGFAVCPGLGDGKFGAWMLTPAEGTWTNLRIADLDLDGHLDVVAMGEMGGLISLLGHGDGTFGTAIPTMVSNDERVLLGDMNEDGNDDVVVTQYRGTTRVLRSDEGRVLTPMPAVTMNVGAVEQTALADFDEDGHLDVVMTRDLSRVRILRGHGDGTLSVLGDRDAGSPLWVGECTGDTHVDLIYSTGNSIAVLPGRGDGSFDPAVVSPAGGPVLSLAIGRLDADAHPDISIITMNNWTTRSWRLGTGNGAGAFTFQTLETSDEIFLETLVRDVNHDGLDDILTTRFTFTPPRFMDAVLSCHLQQLGGVLATPIESAWPEVSRETQLRDINGDGHVDLVTLLESGFEVFIGDGIGHFSMECGYRWSGGGWALGDSDGDGATDVAQANGAEFGMTYGRRDVEPPFIELASTIPFSMSPGHAVAVAWQATDAHTVSLDLFLSRHGASGPFERIASDLPNSGEFLWTVTAPLSDSVVFKAVARDSAGNVGRAKTSGLRSIVAPVSVGEPEVGGGKFALGSVVPNPSRGGLSIGFAIPRAAHVRIALYDVRGREVACILDEDRHAGHHAVDWPRLDRTLPPGLYFLDLRSGSDRATSRVTLLQ